MLFLVGKGVVGFPRGCCLLFYLSKIISKGLVVRSIVARVLWGKLQLGFVACKLFRCRKSLYETGRPLG